MATLILEQNGRRRGSVLHGRVVIGRRSNSHIAIPDRSVSRIHAWIGRADGRYFIADTGSRAGTRVNGQAIQGRQLLDDGDQIRIGPAVMIFGANGSLPPGIEPIDLTDRALASDDGIFMDCGCGAPLWAPWDFAGRAGQCRYCGKMIELPGDGRPGDASDPSGDTMAPGMPSPLARVQVGGVRLTPRRVEAALPKRPSIFDQPTSVPSGVRGAKVESAHDKLCGACQSPISLLEETTRCPECGVAFHAECWNENRGCSSYGCKHVGSLDHKSDAADLATQPEDGRSPPGENISQAPAGRGRAVQWEYVLVLASLAADLLGMLTFGVPALLTGALIATYAMQRRPLRHGRVICLALLLAVIGLMAGIAFSWYWWLTVPAGAAVRA